MNLADKIRAIAVVMGTGEQAMRIALEEQATTIGMDLEEVVDIQYRTSLNPPKPLIPQKRESARRLDQNSPRMTKLRALREFGKGGR